MAVIHPATREPIASTPAGTMTATTKARIAALLPSANWPPSAIANCSVTPTTSIAMTAGHSVFDSAVPAMTSTVPIRRQARGARRAGNAAGP